MMKWILFVLLFCPSAWASPDATAVSETIDDAPVATENACPNPPQGEEATNIAKDVAMTGAICSPMAMAVGGSAIQRAAPATAAAVAKVLGKAGGRLVMSMNVVGGALTAGFIFKSFLGGAASIEQCRAHEIEYKKYIISQVNQRGEGFKKALQGAGFTLTAQDLRRLQFPPAYSEPERIQNMLCGELVLIGEQIKERQNRVYLDKTNGTMRSVPLPKEEERVLSESDKTLIQEFTEGLKCLPPEDFVKGVCAIGNFVLFAKALPPKGGRGGASAVAAGPNRFNPSGAKLTLDGLKARGGDASVTKVRSMVDDLNKNRGMSVRDILTRRGTNRLRSLPENKRQRIMRRAERCLNNLGVK